MPFKKIRKNKYKSPSGRTFTEAQVKLYYATDGFKNKRPKRGSFKKALKVMSKPSNLSASLVMNKAFAGFRSACIAFS